MNPSPDQITPVLAAVIFNAQGQVLLARRKKGLSRQLQWEFPGGKLRPGEKPEEGLAREIQEELGIRIHIEELLEVVNFSYPDRQILLIVYRARYLMGEIRLTDHSEIGWFGRGELPLTEICAADLSILKKLEELDSWKS